MFRYIPDSDDGAKYFQSLLIMALTAKSFSLSLSLSHCNDDGDKQVIFHP